MVKKHSEHSFFQDSWVNGKIELNRILIEQNISGERFL